MCTPPPPPLVDDLIREIVLRLPPDDPACLARASLTCKPWRRILTDRGFLRRYREFHRTPPMLGFLHITLSHYTRIARFVSTSTFCPAALDRRGMCAMSARHGRVLLHTDPYAGPVSLVVWDPVTGEQWALLPPLPVTAPSQHFFSAVLLCAAAGCDNLDCHDRPFAVAFVGWHNGTLHTFACLYSSEAGEWDKPARLDGAPAITTIDNRPGVLVGNAVYLTCIPEETRYVLEYDMDRGELSVIDPPLMHRCQPGTILAVTEDGKLGFVGVHKLSLYLWSREAGPGGQAMPWTQRRVIDLESMHMYFSIGNVPVWHVPSLIGFADGTGEVFLKTEAGRVFSVKLESGRYRKMTSFPRLHNGDTGQEPILIPYMRFYTPGHAT